VARVVALVPDLLFGSKVQGMLAAAGDDVALAGDAARAGEHLAAGADVLVCDLMAPGADPAALVAAAAAGGARTLGVFAHVEPAVRERALAAGFDLVVPRSRMAREGAALVAGLVAGDG
jgi:CheY-like chemotaxis protein